MTSSGGVYLGRQVALLTQHGKERVVASVLKPSLGCRVELVSGYDTDLLGTFTRDVSRAGTQLEAARKKARIGMELSGLQIGLASEGSFGPDPMVGMLPWNVEFLIWIDDELGIEVVGIAQGGTNFAHVLTASWEETEAFAQALRPSESLRVFIETDMRAHANPTRMDNIRLAAEDLARKLCSPCPVCGAPGFWIVERIAGLPCEDCGAPTRATRAEVYGCLKCAHRVPRSRTDVAAAPTGRCDYCNP